jgi:hypothetical protein
MKQILMICAFLIILLLAIVGCLFIFGVMELESATSILLKFGGAILLLGACAALATLLMGKNHS